MLNIKQFKLMNVERLYLRYVTTLKKDIYVTNETKTKKE